MAAIWKKERKQPRRSSNLFLFLLFTHLLGFSASSALSAYAQVGLEVTATPDFVIQTGVAEVLGEVKFSKAVTQTTQTTQSSTLRILYQASPITNAFTSTEAINPANAAILDADGITIHATGGFINAGVTATITADTGSGGQIILGIPAGLVLNDNDSLRINGVRGNVTARPLYSDVSITVDQTPSNAYSLTIRSSQVATVQNGLSVSVSGVLEPICEVPANPSITVTEGFASAFAQFVPVNSVSPLMQRPLYGATHNTQIHVVVSGLPSGVVLTWPDSVTANAGPGTLRVVSRNSSEVLYQFTTTNQSVSDSLAEVFTIIPQVTFGSSVALGQGTIQAQLYPSAGSTSLPRFNDPMQPSSAPAFVTTVECNPAPSLSAINPDSITAGSAPFTLTVTGSNFVIGAKVRWNLQERETTFVSSTELRADILAADVVAAAPVSITVKNPGPGGGISVARAFTINPVSPVPPLLSLDPASITYGGAGFTLTVTGSNFVTGSKVRWNGSDRFTAPVNNTTLRADILASDIAEAGTAVITVFNPTPGGGISNPVEFSITYVRPGPALTSMSPASRPAGSAGFQLTLTGANFVAESRVRWNGQDRGTTYVSSTELRAAILASDTPTAGTATVAVFTPTPGGGLSNALTFSVENPLPAITSLTPSTAAVGSSAFTLTLKGVNFVDGSVVRWNGQNRTTTYVSATQLTAVIPSTDLLSASVARVTVVNLPTGGGESNAEPFTITNQVPTTTSIMPSATLAGAMSVSLTVSGSKFIAQSVVRWNGVDRPTTFVNSGQLSAAIPASDLTTAGTYNVTAANPNPGGGTSNARTFTVNNPLPTLTGVNPSSAAVGAAAFTLTVNGTNFVAGSKIRWNGADLITTYGSFTQLSASIATTLLNNLGAITISVFNGPPGGGASNAQTFTIVNPAPTLTKLSPSSAIAGSSGVSVGVQGTNFVSGSKVRWNGTDITTKFVSSSELTVSLGQSNLAQPGTVPVTVFNPTPGGGTSSALNFTVGNPTPSIANLSPVSAVAGGAAFTLTVNGTKFVSPSKVKWNDQERTTTYVSSTKLTASITADDIAKARTSKVLVANPEDGGASEAVDFTINNPVPTITRSDPVTCRAGDTPFTPALTGTNFTDTSKVFWAGVERETTFVSKTQIKAKLVAEDLAKAGTYKITAVNPAPGGGTSAALNFVVGNALPVITGLAPDNAVAGGQGFTLTVEGRNFSNSAKVRWHGVEKAATFVSDTRLTAAISAGDIASTGARNVTVINNSTDGPSAIAVFTVNPLTLSGVSLTPTSLKGGTYVTGTVFLNGAASAAAVTVSLSSGNKLAATVPATIVIPAGSASATFPVTTSSVSASTAAVISASYGGRTRRATLALGQSDLTEADPVSTLFVPMVLSTAGANDSYYTSALTLANRGTRNAVLDFTYFGAFESSNGLASDVLNAGQQRVYTNAINYLKSLGLGIPDTGNRGGTLRIRCWSLSSPTDISALVRTTTTVTNGRAGLAYFGLNALDGLSRPAFLYGLRQNERDRSNVALQNMGSDEEGEIVLGLTVYSGDPDLPYSQTLPDIPLAPGGFCQINEILASYGINLSNGFVRIERLSGAAPYYAYGVINDQMNSDGSFVTPMLENALAGHPGLTLPVMVETPAYSTELILTNFYGVTRTARCTYVSGSNRSADGAVSFSFQLRPGQQLILPEIIKTLRASGIQELAPPGSSQAGALFVTTDRNDMDGIFVGARTSSAAPDGGRFGLFYPGIPSGNAAQGAAWLFGLQQNIENRTNVALVNTGEYDQGELVFNIDIFDGETGEKKATVENITLGPRQWKQLDMILDRYALGVRQGYARVIRVSGNNPFLAYAVINDGGEPGARTGDGSYIPMVVEP
jgi:hypothetical protein